MSNSINTNTSLEEENRPLRLPYCAEYCKEYSRKCYKWGCFNAIEKGKLTIATIVQSYHDDIKEYNWHHAKCFFASQRPKTVGDIIDFEQLRYKDQQMIKRNIGMTILRTESIRLIIIFII